VAGLGGLAGTIGTIVEYQLVGQLLGAVLAPYEQALTNQVMAATPLVPLSPADLALAVIRAELDEPAAAGEAAMSGLNAERFHTLTRLTGNAPPPEEMAIALRRGFVDAATYLRGIRQGMLRDEWAELTKRLATADPSPVTPLLAELKGQADHATAVGLYEHFGGNPEHYELAYNTEGAGPSPLEAAEAARRGMIPWDGVGAGVTSFAQAVHESAYRNKWLDTFRALAQYLPPPRTITAMYREGSLTLAQATELYQKAGLPSDMIVAYLASGSHQKTAHHKALAETTVLELYHDRLIAGPEAATMLEALGYTAPEAAFILSVKDMQVGQKFLATAVGRVHSLYVGHKIGRTEAVNALGHMGLDPTGISDLTGIWDWERSANVKVLTPAEVATAFFEKIIDQPTAQAEIEGMGYTPFDAWLILSNRLKTPLPGRPAVDAIGAAPGL
jgi:hypothetical protein